MTGIDMKGEMDGIIRGIKSSQYGRMFRIQNLEHCQPHQFISALTTWDPDIVHFAGHGNTSSLTFLDENENRADMNKADFDILIEAARKRSLRGLVFNACFSAHDAPRFTQLGVNVISMQRPVGDGAAKWFSALFYDKLGHGKTFKKAFDEASRLVEGEYGETFHPEYFDSDQNRPVRML
jgi:CHAT domain-containing protein